MKAEQTITSGTCHSNIAQTPCQTENQDKISSAAGTTCCTRESCDPSSKPSHDCGACSATTGPNDCLSADEHLKTAATDCVHKCCSTTDSSSVESCCPEPKETCPSEPCVPLNAANGHVQSDTDVAEKSVSCNGEHSAPCAEGTPCAILRKDDCMKAETTVTSTICHSNITQTSCRTENQDNTSSAAGTKRCCTQESVCDTSSKLIDDCGACTATTAPNDCLSTDEQLKKTAATDCAHECCSTTVETSCTEPKEPCTSYVFYISRLYTVIKFLQRALCLAGYSNR
ncbi:uncharacterized protein EDB93DRAFT_475180 [Suillus bovinus]|uniref:uncharacterized protein n=1 Tax=Suillus bovinus TaxID=48563 RepID=UPI001B863D1B|nr:uncharacterized protein EDB93DRAFT_475180 [Suillus bovinus]KAG2146431.1 hypothetical protein EDB93DRAFT_475180 [Suillus bovinus]